MCGLGLPRCSPNITTGQHLLAGGGGEGMVARVMQPKTTQMQSPVPATPSASLSHMSGDSGRSSGVERFEGRDVQRGDQLEPRRDLVSVRQGPEQRQRPISAEQGFDRFAKTRPKLDLPGHGATGCRADVCASRTPSSPEFTGWLKNQGQHFATRSASRARAQAVRPSLTEE